MTGSVVGSAASRAAGTSSGRRTAQLATLTTTGSSTSAKPARRRSRRSGLLMIADRATPAPPFPSRAARDAVRTSRAAAGAAPGCGCLVGMQLRLARFRQVPWRTVRMARCRLGRFRMVRRQLVRLRPRLVGYRLVRLPPRLVGRRLVRLPPRPVRRPRLRAGHPSAIATAGTSARRTGRPTLPVRPMSPAPALGTSLGLPAPGRQVRRGLRQCGPTECGRTQGGPTRVGPTCCGPTRVGPTCCGPTRRGPTQCGAMQRGPRPRQGGEEPIGQARIGCARQRPSRRRRPCRRPPRRTQRRHRNGACTAGPRPSNETTPPTALPRLGAHWTLTSGAAGRQAPQLPLTPKLPMYGPSMMFSPASRPSSAAGAVRVPVRVSLTARRGVTPVGLNPAERLAHRKRLAARIRRRGTVRGR